MSNIIKFLTMWIIFASPKTNSDEEIDEEQIIVEEGIRGINPK